MGTLKNFKKMIRSLEQEAKTSKENVDLFLRKEKGLEEERDFLIKGLEEKISEINEKYEKRLSENSENIKRSEMDKDLKILHHEKFDEAISLSYRQCTTYDDADGDPHFRGSDHRYTSGTSLVKVISITIGFKITEDVFYDKKNIVIQVDLDETKNGEFSFGKKIKRLHLDTSLKILFSDGRSGEYTEIKGPIDMFFQNPEVKKMMGFLQKSFK